MWKTSNLSQQYFSFLLIWRKFSYSCFGHVFAVEQSDSGMGCHLRAQMQNLFLKHQWAGFIRRVGQPMLISTFSSYELLPQFGGRLLLFPVLRCSLAARLDVPSPWLHQVSWHFKSAHACQLEHSRLHQEKKIRQTQRLQETFKLDTFKLNLDYLKSNHPCWVSTHWSYIEWFSC